MVNKFTSMSFYLYSVTQHRAVDASNSGCSKVWVWQSERKIPIWRVHVYFWSSAPTVYWQKIHHPQLFGSLVPVTSMFRTLGEEAASKHVCRAMVGTQIFAKLVWPCPFLQGFGLCWLPFLGLLFCLKLRGSGAPRWPQQKFVGKSSQQLRLARHLPSTMVKVKRASAIRSWRQSLKPASSMHNNSLIHMEPAHGHKLRHNFRTSAHHVNLHCSEPTQKQQAKLGPLEGSSLRLPGWPDQAGSEQGPLIWTVTIMAKLRHSRSM